MWTNNEKSFKPQFSGAKFNADLKNEKKKGGVLHSFSR